jgi:hypothetical protein
MKDVKLFTDTKVVNAIMNRINSKIIVDSIMETKGGYIVANANALYYVLHTFYPSIHEKKNSCSKKRYIICEASREDLSYFSKKKPTEFLIALPNDLCTDLVLVELTLPFANEARKLNEEALKIYDPWKTDAVAEETGAIRIGGKHFYPDSRSLFLKSQQTLLEHHL